MKHRSTAYILIGILPLIVVPVWMAGGAYKPWQTSFLWLCLWAWCFFFLQPETKNLPSRIGRAKKLMKDPITWLSFSFMGYIYIQYLNTGRIQMFDFDLNKYVYSKPPVPWLPSSFTRTEALEMIRWFGPTLTFLLILRNTWKAIDVKSFIWLVCLNGFCTVLLAFVQQAMGLDKMYNIRGFGRDYFGTFGYPNHAAVFYILLFAIALGLFLREVLCESSERDLPTLIFSGIWAPTFFMAANLTTSRAGILGAWLVLFLSLISLAIIMWPRTHPVEKVYGFIGISMLIGLFISLFIIFAKPIHIKELKGATVTLNVATEIESRYFQIEAAYKMWLDYPIYGTGGWGYRYIGSHYKPQSQWRMMMGRGKANVHNDWMQFLSEFGIIGFGLLIGSFLPRIIQVTSSTFKHPVKDDSVWADPFKICVFWGLIMLLLDSQFDIPLRSPALVIHATLLLFILSPHASRGSLWQPLVDWKRLQPPALSFKSKKKENQTGLQ